MLCNYAGAQTHCATAHVLLQRTLGKLFTHIASTVSQLQETGVQKGVFGAYVVMAIKCTRL